MPRTPAAAPADPQPALSEPGLRQVPGGYELDALPFHQQVKPGESFASWLRRLASRYGVAPRGLLAECGATRVPPATNRSLSRYVAKNPDLGRRLGLSTVDIEVLTARPAIEAATDHYLRSFRRTLARPRRATSRYCPAAWPTLTRTGRRTGTVPCRWSARARVGVGHHLPGLRHAPWAPGPGSVTAGAVGMRRPIPPRAARKVRPFCQGDLRLGRSMAATDEQHLAQLLLTEFATHPHQKRRACGVTITGRIGFHAMVELIDARLEDEAAYLDLATDPADVVEALAEALTIIGQPTLAEAAEAGFHLLSPRRRHAPIGPASTVRAGPHNPLLVAIQLTRLGDQLPPADQLMFRTANRIPRYPGLARDRTPGWQRLPDIRRLPDPSIAWLPQILWPDALPKQVMQHADTPVRSAALAMAAARVGTDHSWPLIALELGLPTAATTCIGALWTRTRRDGTWPAALTALDRLIDRLQRHTPPIDYQIRRIIGDDTTLLTAAVNHACHDDGLPCMDDPLLLVRRFWELFTGGDIAYAPPALTIPVADHRYQAYRAAAASLTAARPHSPPRSPCQDEVPQPYVGPGQGDGDCGDDDAVAGEPAEGDRVALAAGDSGDDDVRAGADSCGVAAQVGPDGQRPPQGRRLRSGAAGHQPFHERHHGRHVGNVVDHAGEDGGSE